MCNVSFERIRQNKTFLYSILQICSLLYPIKIARCKLPEGEHNHPYYSAVNPCTTMMIHFDTAYS